MGILRRQTRRARRPIPPWLWKATYINDCDLWLRADDVQTGTGAAVAFANDLSQSGTWLRNNVDNFTTFSFTDTVDAAPTTHYIREVAVPNIRVKHDVRWRIGIPASSGGGRYVEVVVGGGGKGVVVDTQTFTVTDQTGLTNITYVAGILEFNEPANASTSDIRFYTNSSGLFAGGSYQGTGARSVTLGDNGLGALVTATQIPITQANDKSGLAHHCSQGTSANCPILVTPSDGNGKAAIRCNGTTDTLVSANVNWTGVTGCTVFVVAKKSGSALMSALGKGTSGSSGGFEVAANVAAAGGYSWDVYATDSVPAFDAYTTNSYTYPDSASPTIVSSVIDTTAGTEERVWVNGWEETLSVLAAADLSNLDSNTPYYFAARSASRWFSGDVYEVIVYKRALSTLERRQVELALAYKYHIFTDQYLAPNFAALYSLYSIKVHLDARYVTTVDADILDPSDISTANWHPLNYSARTASRVTEDSSAAVVHGVIQNPGTSNITPYSKAHVRVGLPHNADANGRYAIVVASSGNEAVFVDMTNDVVHRTQGDVSNVTYLGGVLEFDSTFTGAGNFYVLTGDGGPTLTHNGNGLRYVQLGDNGLGEYCTVTQKNISSANDQSGNANHFPQSTATLRPLLVESAYNGLPTMRGSTSATAAPHKLDKTTGVAYGTNGSLFVLLKASSAASSHEVSAIGGSNDSIITRFSASLTEWFNGNGTDRLTYESAPTGLHLLGMTQVTGGRLSVFLDGAQAATKSPPVNALHELRYILGYGGAGNGSDGDISAVVLSTRHLTMPERRQVDRLMANPYGVALAA